MYLADAYNHRVQFSVVGTSLTFVRGFPGFTAPSDLALSLDNC